MKSFWLTVLAVFVAASIGVSEAQAKRLGGGRDIGKQAPSGALQRNSTPSSPAGQGSSAATPATPAAPAAAPSAVSPRPAAAQQAASPRSRWMGPIAGLAAGLGLAALASHFGFGEQLANMMMIGLMVMATLAVVGWIMSRRATAARREPAYAGGYGTTGLGQEASVPNYQPVQVPAASRDHPIDVVRSAAAPVATNHVPDGFDTEAFVRSAKVCFVRLQAAYDAGNANDLREFTSPEMFAELKLEIDARNGAANQTDVVTLDAQLLGVESGVTEQIGSVRFTGMIREEAGAPAQPFDEVWNFARPVGEQGGWVLAGIQQLNPA